MVDSRSNLQVIQVTHTIPGTSSHFQTVGGKNSIDVLKIFFCNTFGKQLNSKRCGIVERWCTISPHDAHIGPCLAREVHRVHRVLVQPVRRKPQGLVISPINGKRIHLPDKVAQAQTRMQRNKVCRSVGSGGKTPKPTPPFRHSPNACYPLMASPAQLRY